MNTEFDFNTTSADASLAYVRPVKVVDLPAKVRAQAEGLDTIYAVHNEDGEQLALVRDRDLAYVIARQNDMEPVAVH